MNIQTKIAKLSPTQRLNARRVDELGLASAALLGIAHVRGPVTHSHQAVVMTHLDELFGFTSEESQSASDTLFEATLNHAIHDTDRPRIIKCALRLAKIAKHYDGSENHDRAIWQAGFELFEIDGLFDAGRGQ